MLSISKMTMGQDGYYAELAREDYYLEGGEPPGQWLGTGAGALGLMERVNNEDFRSLFAGQFRGRDLVQNAGSGKRCPGWDCTFSAPKSVSVAWSQADTATANEFRAAHLEAVEKAVGYLEERCGWTRRGHGGAEMEKGRLVFAAFEHGTSRAQDPQLHTHAVLLNLCLRQDGTTGALDTRALYSHKMTAGALYRAELARQLEARLGLESVPKGNLFELQGVPKSLCDEFSKRRKEIEAKLDEMGAKGAVASARLAITTRSHKQHESREELSQAWKKVGEAFRWSTQQLHGLMGRVAKRSEDELNLYAHFCAVKAVEKITASRSSFTEREAVRVVAETVQGRGVGAERVIAACVKMLGEARDIHRLGNVDGEVRFTTQEILNLEQDMMKRVERSQAGQGTTVSEQSLFDVFKKPRKMGKGKTATLTEEQAAAVRHICQSRGWISVITGDAGTGKTFMLDAAREALEAEGYRVKGAALSGKAADGLQRGANIQSQTIASLLWEAEKSTEMFDVDKARRDYNKWRNKQPFKNIPVFNAAKAAKAFYEKRIKSPLDARTVLVVDEAGMVDTRQLAKLIELCEQSGAKLALVGDNKQLQAISIGGGFQGIESLLGSERLTENFRQVDEAAKKAVRKVGAGRAGEALEFYAQQGALTVAENKVSAKAELISDWVNQGGRENPADHLILAGRNLDVTALNRDAQKQRVDEGLTSKDSIAVAGENFHRGDRILFTRNKKALGIQNGNLGTVEKFSRLLGTLTVRLDSGEKRTISTATYDHVKLGYAVTTHKSQGMTAENAFILTDESMQDKELSYVQVSRAKHATRLYTTREEAGEGLADLARRMQSSREKELAILQQQRARTTTGILTL